MVFDKKSLEIINFLGENKNWKTCYQISQKLNLTPRSIRHIISKINKQKHVIDSSNRGYLLIENDIKSCYPDSNIPLNPEERKKYIFHHLVIHNEIFNIDDLSEHLHISPTTLLNSLPSLKKDLSNFNLYLKTKQNKLYVIGKERDKQRFAIELIRNELEHSNFSLDNLQRYFKTVNLNDIKNLVTGVFSKYQYFLDDFSLLNYILHLAVCIELNSNADQKQNGTDFLTSSIEKLRLFASNDTIVIVNEIAEHLKNMYGTSFSIDNIIDASILMTTRIKAKHNNKIDFKNIAEVVGDEIRDLIVYLTSSINDKYSIDLSNTQMMIRFALHLKNTLIRLTNNIPIQAIQFENIKNEYPFLYDMAVYVSYLIAHQTSIILPENEIAYIALHLGVMIEQDATFHEKLTCVILSTDYYAIGKKLFKSISRILGDQLFIQDLLTNLDNYDDLATDIDLIITTYPIRNVKTPYIIVGPFLSESAISEINSKIEKIKLSKRKSYLISIIERFFKEDLCFFEKNFKTADDAIDEICDYMIEKQYVDSSFKKEIYEHEKIAPSSYGNIAITHTFTNSSLPSIIAMSVNPTPIIWGENKVNIVIIFSLNEKDKKLFKDIFRFMTDIITNNQAFSNILKATNYVELKEIIRYYI